MRGGAIPLLAWALLLAILMAVNWIWTGDAIQVATFGFATLAVLTSAVILAVRSRREALKPGPPAVVDEPEAIPVASLGSVLIAVSLSSIVFGLAFGRFLMYFGAALLIVSTGAVLRERRTQAQTRRAFERDRT